MDSFDNNKDLQLNLKADLFDEEDAILKEHFKTYQNIVNNISPIDSTEYIYSANEDDEKIPDFIVSEFEAFINEQFTSTDDINMAQDMINNNETTTKTKPLSSKQHHIPNLESSSNISADTLQRPNWEIISLVDKIKTGANAAIYISVQKFSNNYYVVFTKTSNKRKTKNFSLPISVAKFISVNLLEAFKNKDKPYTSTPTSRDQWYLCKEYGTIYPHPINYITITHQTCKAQDYIVLSKYDRHNKQKNFAFPISYSKEISNALKKSYKTGKKFANKIFAIFYPYNHTEYDNSSRLHSANILKCICGRNPEISELHVDYFDRPGVWHSHCYCPYCNLSSKISINSKEQAIAYWNEMIRSISNYNTEKR